MLFSSRKNWIVVSQNSSETLQKRVSPQLLPKLKYTSLGGKDSTLTPVQCLFVLLLFSPWRKAALKILLPLAHTVSPVQERGRGTGVQGNCWAECLSSQC